MSLALAEAGDHWALALPGATVSQIRVDYQLTLLLDSEGGAVEVAVEHPVALTAPDGDTTAVDWQSDPTVLAPVLALLHAGVESALAFKDGRLEIALADGRRLAVGADEDFEPWSLTGPDGLRVVSAPGGELSVWSPAPGGAVELRAGSVVWPIGAADFLHAFFSTVAVRLEPGGWGSRFPAVMRTLYAGEIGGEEAARALAELDQIRAELRAFRPDEVVWDAEDRDRRPPWGDDVADTITDLGNYFVTAGGRDLLDVLDEAVGYAARSEYPLVVER